ncbi:hypothetical protein IFM89_035142 [Coptis chinensis]|uniref:DEAD/DEAH-box helicase domain-containing protein n=1 Tax=Coptis chinensis TaxID=261450 RepID=A0A835ISQ8_9MAGN|nr:hypothetical protein IFM89_035142 [Coptis chinensis]
MGFSSLFPIQVAAWQETIGPGAFDRDLCINSPTGSGKTLAYALPIVQMLSTRSVKCRKETVLDLAKFVDKGVQVKLIGQRQVTWTLKLLKGYDQLLNLVFDEAIKSTKDW